MTKTPAPTHATFTVERSYALPPEQVFSAWSEPTAKARWFASPGARHHLDFRVGGTETTHGEHSPGATLTFTSTYQVIRPAELIVYSSTLSSGATLSTVSITTVEFLAEAGSTRLVLTEYGVFLHETEIPEWRERGTRDWLDHLSLYLAAPAD